MTHELKLQEPFCTAIYDGTKTFEIRKNDRGYQTGDKIKFIPVHGHGIPMVIDHPIKHCLFTITYVLSSWGLEPGYVCLSIVKDTI